MGVKATRYNETENGYPRQGIGDKDGEYSYIFTHCGNYWYSVNKNPMKRDRCVCPKCGRIINVVME